MRATDSDLKVVRTTTYIHIYLAVLNSTLAVGNVVTMQPLSVKLAFFIVVVCTRDVNVTTVRGTSVSYVLRITLACCGWCWILVYRSERVCSSFIQAINVVYH